MSVPLAITEAAHAAARPARAVSDTAAVTAGVEAALAADRRYWARRLLTRLGDLPITAGSQRELVVSLAEESTPPPTTSTTEPVRRPARPDEAHAYHVERSHLTSRSSPNR